MRNLVFCDTETTGLDPAKDHVVELALVAVSLPRFDIVAQFDMVVTPPMWPTVERNMHEKVRTMHAASGLLHDLATRARASTAEVETEALAFMRMWAPHTMAWKTPMAGANPSFDRGFLKRHMPKLENSFMYRNFDVRTLTLLSDWVFGTMDSEGAPHRALADCKKAIHDVRKFLGIES